LAEYLKFVKSTITTEKRVCSAFAFQLDGNATNLFIVLEVKHNLSGHRIAWNKEMSFEICPFVRRIKEDFES
jgi:hypothetical protein